jgi:hypothetical protein
MKTKCLIAIIIGILVSCDRDSAIDSGEYCRNRAEFIGSQVARVTIYDVPERKWWSEEAMRRKHFPSVGLSGKSADKFASDIMHRVDSGLVGTPSEKKNMIGVSFVAVIENDIGKKLIVLFDRVLEGENVVYIFASSYEKSWWFEIDRSVYDRFPWGQSIESVPTNKHR